MVVVLRAVALTLAAATLAAASISTNVSLMLGLGRVPVCQQPRFEPVLDAMSSP